MPFDRPSKQELVTAVREFLEDKLLSELKGHLGFNTRVSINVLKILERQLESGTNINERTRARLAELLSTDVHDVRELNQMLCEAIDKGEFTYRDKTLINHLWQTTMDKLSVDNPRYVSYQRELENQKKA